MNHALIKAYIFNIPSPSFGILPFIKGRHWVILHFERGITKLGKGAEDFLKGCGHNYFLYWPTIYQFNSCHFSSSQWSESTTFTSIWTRNWRHLFQLTISSNSQTDISQLAMNFCWWSTLNMRSNV